MKILLLKNDDFGATIWSLQCKAAMDAAGMSCPADKINLVCFNAGGYPKKTCKTKWCDLMLISF